MYNSQPLHIPTAEPGLVLLQSTEHADVFRDFGLGGAALDDAFEQSSDTTTGEQPIDDETIQMGIWEAETPIGGAWLQPHDADARIGFWVHPDFRGCGFGTLAATALTAHAAQQSPTVSARVSAENTDAIGVLERIGYSRAAAQAGRVTFEYGDTGQPEIPNIGVLKRALPRYRSGTHVYEETSTGVEQMVRKFAGAKNKATQTALMDTIAWLQANPYTEASEALRDRPASLTGEPLKLMRLKPSSILGYEHGHALTDVRLIYAILEGEAGKSLALLEIINRSDLNKNY